MALVFPSFRHPSFDIPWGITNIGTYLKNNYKDLKVEIIDLGLHNGTGYLEKRFRILKPDIVGIYINVLLCFDALKAAQIAKESHAMVIIGGPLATISPEAIIKSQYVDALCIGEGEFAMAEFINYVFDKEPVSQNSGLWLKEEGAIIKNDNGNNKPYFDLDENSISDLRLLEVESYIRRWFNLDSFRTNLRGLSFVISRGCPFRCTFCKPTADKIFGTQLRIRSAAKMVEDIKKLKKDYDLEAFYFTDDNLTVFKNWLHEFCNLLIKNNLNFVWSCNSRVDTADEDLLRLMKASGCVKIRSGIECASDRLRNDIYNKGIDLERINIFLETANKVGIQVSGYFIIGGPTETVKEIKDTVKFAVNSSLEEAVFKIATPFPATYLYDIALSKEWKFGALFGEYDYCRPGAIKRDLSSMTLELLKKYAYLRFYLDKKRINKTMKIIFSDSGPFKTLTKLKTYV